MANNKNNKNTTKTAEAETKKRFQIDWKGIGFGIIGVSLLLGVLSIGYMAAYVIMGTTGLAPKVLCAPGILLGVLIAVWKFCK